MSREVGESLMGIRLLAVRSGRHLVAHQCGWDFQASRRSREFWS